MMIYISVNRYICCTVNQCSTGYFLFCYCFCVCLFTILYYTWLGVFFTSSYYCILILFFECNFHSFRHIFMGQPLSMIQALSCLYCFVFCPYLMILHQSLCILCCTPPPPNPIVRRIEMFFSIVPSLAICRSYHIIL